MKRKTDPNYLKRGLASRHHINICSIFPYFLWWFRANRSQLLLSVHITVVRVSWTVRLIQDAWEKGRSDYLNHVSIKSNCFLISCRLTPLLRMATWVLVDRIFHSMSHVYVYNFPNLISSFFPDDDECLFIRLRVQAWCLFHETPWELTSSVYHQATCFSSFSYSSPSRLHSPAVFYKQYSTFTPLHYVLSLFVRISYGLRPNQEV